MSATLRLGELIEALEAQPQDNIVKFLFTYDNPAALVSWRGDYQQLSVDYSGYAAARTVSEMLADCRFALGGAVFEGYKGGEYSMNKYTEVWADAWGDCGSRAILVVRQEGHITRLVTTADVVALLEENARLRAELAAA